MSDHYTPPWSLRRRGQADSHRHDKRIEEAIKHNLKDLISEESIISSDGTRRIRIPIKYLEQYRFKVGTPQPGVGQGKGTVGDILWQPGMPGEDHRDAGEEHGEHDYEAEVDLETLTRLMLEDLALPWLEDKPYARELASDVIEFHDIRRKGALAHLEKRRTMMANLKRHAVAREPRRVNALREEDLRFRTWDVHQETITQAAVYCCMDWSGSMTTEKKWIAKAFFFWMVRFVRLKYPHVNLVFLAHDTEAELVTERDFFGRGAGGGTICSSVYKMALAHMAQYHPASRWNVYLFHFSDGDNLESDNALCRSLVEALLRECQQVGYGEIPWARTTAPAPSSLLQVLQQIAHPHFLTTVLRTKDDVGAALTAFFGLDAVASRMSVM